MIGFADCVVILVVPIEVAIEEHTQDLDGVWGLDVCAVDVEIWSSLYEFLWAYFVGVDVVLLPLGEAEVEARC